MAEEQDGPALRRLAGRDSSVVPAGPLLVAEVDGVLLAAFSPGEQRAIADPFHPTAALVELLRTHWARERARPAAAAERLRPAVAPGA